MKLNRGMIVVVTLLLLVVFPLTVLSQDEKKKVVVLGENQAKAAIAEDEGHIIRGFGLRDWGAARDEGRGWI
jgi:hypothetical protein